MILIYRYKRAVKKLLKSVNKKDWWKNVRKHDLLLFKLQKKFNR